MSDAPPNWRHLTCPMCGRICGVTENPDTGVYVYCKNCVAWGQGIVGSNVIDIKAFLDRHKETRQRNRGDWPRKAS